LALLTSISAKHSTSIQIIHSALPPLTLQDYSFNVFHLVTCCTTKIFYFRCFDQFTILRNKLKFPLEETSTTILKLPNFFTGINHIFCKHNATQDFQIPSPAQFEVVTSWGICKKQEGSGTGIPSYCGLFIRLRKLGYTCNTNIQPGLEKGVAAMSANMCYSKPRVLMWS
jgi:hypothetical protein